MSRKLVKEAALIINNSTHSISSVFNTIEFIKKDNSLNNKTLEQLNRIENAYAECKTQMDKLFTIIKELSKNE
jgi:hypothetical protein